VGVDVGAGRHGAVGEHSRSLVPCVSTHGPFLREYSRSLVPCVSTHGPYYPA
jgi:hypothetical protein